MNDFGEDSISDSRQDKVELMENVDAEGEFSKSESCDLVSQGIFFLESKI